MSSVKKDPSLFSRVARTLHSAIFGAADVSEKFNIVSEDVLSSVERWAEIEKKFMQQSQPHKIKMALLQNEVKFLLSKVDKKQTLVENNNIKIAVKEIESKINQIKAEIDFIKKTCESEI
jgi:hypothetical protein